MPPSSMEHRAQAPSIGVNRVREAGLSGFSNLEKQDEPAFRENIMSAG